MRAQLTHWVAMLLVYACCVMGVFYGALKFHIPWYGANDYVEYSKVVEHPVSTPMTSRFFYRRVTPLVGAVLNKTGLYYAPNESPFQEHYTHYQGRIYRYETYAALIMANTVMIVFGLCVMNATLRRVIKPQTVYEDVAVWGLPLLHVLAWSTVYHGFGGLTEGGTFAVVACLLYAYVAQRQWVFGLVMMVGVFQRELIPFMITAYLVGRHVTGGRVTWAHYLACAIGGLGVWGVRWMWPDPTISEFAVIASGLQLSVTKAWFLQCIMANNIVGIALIGWAILKGPVWRFALPFAMVFGLLFAMSLGVGNNLGRIVTMATPFLILDMARYLVYAHSDGRRLQPTHNA